MEARHLCRRLHIHLILKNIAKHDASSSVGQHQYRFEDTFQTDFSTFQTQRAGCDLMSRLEMLAIGTNVRQVVAQ